MLGNSFVTVNGKTRLILKLAPEFLCNDRPWETWGFLIANRKTLEGVCAHGRENLRREEKDFIEQFPKMKWKKLVSVKPERSGMVDVRWQSPFRVWKYWKFYSRLGKVLHCGIRCHHPEIFSLAQWDYFIASFHASVFQATCWVSPVFGFLYYVQ